MFSVSEQEHGRQNNGWIAIGDDKDVKDEHLP